MDMSGSLLEAVALHKTYQFVNITKIVPITEFVIDLIEPVDLHACKTLVEPMLFARSRIEKQFANALPD